MQKKSGIKNIQAHDRPREKIRDKGAQSLTDEELWQVLLSTGSRKNDITVLAKQISSLVLSTDISLSNLMEIEGMGFSKSTKVLAVCEIVSRSLRARNLKLNEIKNLLLIVEEYRYRTREHLLLITVNGSYEMIKRRVVSIGTLNSTLIHPREIFAFALRDHAAGFYLVHNHPSGNPLPSAADHEVTRQLDSASNTMGIKLIDHLIISRNGNYSFREGEC